MGSFPGKDKKAPKDFQVRIGEDELGRIFHLRESLDQSEILIQHADRYRDLGWILEPWGEEAETLDFTQSSEAWGERLMTLALAGVEVNLGIRTGLPSCLLVLEAPRGETILDSYGEWRSVCRALAGEDWEQHYFALPPGSRLPASGRLENFHLRIYAQDGVVLAPPSRCPHNGQMWNWLSHPWEIPPDPPGPSVWEFLEDFGFLQETAEVEILREVLPWDQVYALIAPQENLIRTLLAPAVSMSNYYRDLAHQARLGGITDQAVLFSLLWHAPQGDARTSLERLAYIRDLVAAITSEPAGGSENVPFQEPASETPFTPLVQPAPVNDMVEFMENRVVLDRSRYESMIYELAELTAKAEALQRRLNEWESRYDGGQPQSAMESISIFQEPKIVSQAFPFDPAVGSHPPGYKRQSLSSLKAVVQEFLKNNSDLAGDEESVRMLQFCLRNYIDLNPELNPLPLGEKLEMAGEMARKFLIQVCPRGA
jgi:hypothetical protein